jgi:hypothetical protein
MWAVEEVMRFLRIPHGDGRKPFTEVGCPAISPLDPEGPWDFIAFFEPSRGRSDPDNMDRLEFSRPSRNQNKRTILSLR